MWWPYLTAVVSRLLLSSCDSGCGAGQAWGQQSPGSGHAACALRGSQGAWAVGQPAELREVLAISSLLFLPLASSAERFTSSLYEGRRGENMELCVGEGLPGLGGR